MSAALVIVLREGLEVALVLSIILGYLERTGRAHLRPAVWRGAGLTAVAALALGLLIMAATSGLSDRTMALLEGITMLFACAVLTWMIVWMRSHARSMGQVLRERVDVITTGAAMTVFAAVAVGREALETVLFLFAASSAGAGTGSIIIGAIIGGGIATVAGAAILSSGRRLDVGRWFRWTGVALVLFAANSLGYGLHELREWSGYSGPLSSPAWQIEHGPLANGPLRELLGMFGWSPHPEWLRLLAYGAYAAIMLRWLLHEPQTPRLPAAAAAVQEAASVLAPHQPAPLPQLRPAAEPAPRAIPRPRLAPLAPAPDPVRRAPMQRPPVAFAPAELRPSLPRFEPPPLPPLFRSRAADEQSPSPQA